MERSLIKTKLPLDRFAKLVGYSPILFSQVYVGDSNDGLQPASSCSDPVMQYTYQPRGGGQPGREEIAIAIAQAESDMEQQLGYSLLPTWQVDENLVVPRKPGNWYTRPYDIRLITNAGYVMYGGVEAWSVISAGATVVYTDENSDGYYETATVTVATSVTDTNEISVFYPGESHAQEWEIRPLKVTITAGVATIVFSRHLAALPDLLEALDATGVNGLDDTNFLTTVDVYRHYNDPSTMGIVEWAQSLCDSSGCEVSAQTACISPRNERVGVVNVHAATWDSDDDTWTHTCPTWWATPDRVRLWYRAGYRDKSLARPDCDMFFPFARAVALLALCNLDREILSCEQLRNLQAYWRLDLAQRESTPAQSKSFQVSRKVLDNPFGTTRGAGYAWRVVQPLIRGQAVLGT